MQEGTTYSQRKQIALLNPPYNLVLGCEACLGMYHHHVCASIVCATWNVMGRGGKRGRRVGKKGEEGCPVYVIHTLACPYACYNKETINQYELPMIINNYAAKHIQV